MLIRLAGMNKLLLLIVTFGLSACTMTAPDPLEKMPVKVGQTWVFKALDRLKNQTFTASVVVTEAYAEQKVQTIKYYQATARAEDKPAFVYYYPELSRASVLVVNKLGQNFNNTEGVQCIFERVEATQLTGYAIFGTISEIIDQASNNSADRRQTCTYTLEGNAP
jgi:hypothetical protein